ncbi:helix-turn-helix transcriptional regulator [Streptomyces sp. NPDC046716]|uniref:helix-turn-helix transcriptional regulator n=1 Tax=Streptomyces sp. NPDC046716 TaxID=3157093 RepID=UPI0033E411F3
METTLFESESLSATEEFLSRAFTPMTIGGRPSDTRARIARRSAGELTVDELAFGYTMSYDAGPLDKLCLVSMNQGVHTSGEEACGPGETFLVAQPDRPYSGEVREADYTIVSFGPEHLQAAAGPSAGRVRLTGTRAVSPEANRLLHSTVAYLRDVVFAPAGTDAPSSPLLIGNALRHLAAVTLTCLPNTTHDSGPTRTDTRDARPHTLGRALTYIDENAHRDIGLADIAAAAFVTPRALQYAFTRHAGTTPLAHLRRVRLARAHDDLKAAFSGETTVAEIAARWGFAHAGRFSGYYRDAYGIMPIRTLKASD